MLKVGKVLSFLLLLRIIGICIAPCPEEPNTYTGSAPDQGQQTDIGLSILVDSVPINCCGFITGWTTDAYVSGTVNAQVWRPNGGGSYQLLGYNTLSVTGGIDQVHTVNAGERIRVDVNDLIGIQSTGTLPLRVERQSANNKATYVTGMTSDISLNTIWPPGTPTTGTRNEYGLLASIQQSSPPTFIDLSAVLFYNHAMTVGMILKTLDATQNDPGDLTFTLSAGGLTYFTIAAGSNNITLLNVPPKQNYTVTVRVTDPCGQSTNGNVVICVMNQPPTIHNLDNTIAISEDTSPGTLIFSVNATDTLTDPVLCTGTNTVLEVKNADNGVYLKTGASLDYDVISSYSIDVSCTDNDDVVVATLTVNLIRNEPPVINSLPDFVSFLEDISTRTLLHTLNVTDPTNDPVTCALVSASALFDVSYIPASTDYGIYLTGGTTLDYDTTSSYSLPIKCQDHRRDDIETFTVNLIRNTPPTINNLPDSTSISENLATRSLLLTLNVTDVNIADVVTCSLSTFNSLFEIVKIGTSDDYGIFLKGGTTLDYDITSSYALSITCADHRRNDVDIFTVNLIRNEPPTILNLPKSLEIAEATSSETLLWTVSATDPTNDTITCSAVSSSIFRIENGAVGLVSESKVYLNANAGLHYDTQRSYTIDVTCADQRRNDTSTLYVYVQRNMPPYFTNLQGKTSIPATSTVGQPVFTVQSIDPENDQLQYSMTSQQANAPFVINQNTGEITLTRSIKYESVTGYDLLISVSDGRNIYGSKTLTILITGINSPPSFRNLPQSITVSEGTTVGLTVFQPAVDDKDTSDVHSYSAFMSPPEGAVYFNVNKTTGSVTIIKDLDYENIPMKTFLATITVTDSLMEDTQNLTLNILNVNEAPRFTKKNYAFTVSENNKGTVLQNPYYEYNDQDGDTLKFTFNCGEATGLLDMASATGFFSYAVDYDLDAEGMPSLIQCQVYVSDDEYTDMAYLNITVLNANDNSPRFEHSEYTFYMPISTSIGSTVGQVLATDIDTGIYGNILYHLDQETLDTGLFKVSSNGVITLANSIDTVASEGSVLNMTVYAVDEGGNQDVTYVNVVIPDTTVQQGIEDNTIQYFTFFTYAPNMAWFVPAIVASIIAISFPVYLIWKYGCCDIREILKECTDKKKNTRSKKFSTRRKAAWNPWRVWERK